MLSERAREYTDRKKRSTVNSSLDYPLDNAVASAAYWFTGRGFVGKMLECFARHANYASEAYALYREPDGLRVFLKLPEDCAKESCYSVTELSVSSFNRVKS